MMMTKRVRFIIVAVIAGIFVGGCDCGNPEALATLKIERPEKDERAVDPETGMITRRFPVLRGFLTRELADTKSGRTDPFSGPSSEGRQNAPVPAEKFLGAAGIEFPEGTGAEYDSETEILTVTQLPEWMDVVEAYLDQRSYRGKVVNLRMEIFEVPAALALRLEQSASEHFDHEPELLALREVVERGEARFVTSANVQATSGQRSRSDAAEEVIYFTGFTWDKETEPARLKPEFEVRDVGTLLEVDPVIGPDGLMIDVNFQLEHHTAPPSWTSAAIPVPGEEEPVSVEIPHFHVKTMVTQITLVSGDTKLLGSWRPTGLPAFEEADVMRIVFLRGDVQESPIN